MARFAAEMHGHVHLARIRAHIEGGKRSGVRGTPGFFNGTIQDVSFGLRSLFEATEAKLERRR